MRHEINTNSPKTLVLGAYFYDLTSNQLIDANGKEVHLRQQSENVLSILVQRPNCVVSKVELFETVWPDTATTDDSLVQCIADIRRVVGASIIETFPKKGYRLNSRELSRSAIPKTVIRPTVGTKYALVVAIILVLSVLTFLFVRFEQQTVASTSKAKEITLAVLPFVNLSDDPNLRFLSDGLSQDLTTDLSKIGNLIVISHSSSFKYAEAESGFKLIAKSLGASHLVRGTIRHHGNRVRINVSLVDPFSGANLWAERFDQDKNNPLGIQSSVVHSIAEALSLPLVDARMTKPADNPESYFMLLRGLEYFRSLSPDDNLKARRYFERALVLDPEYARAYANIAVTYGRESMFNYSSRASEEAVTSGLEAAITAIRLDSSIPNAYFALGVLNLAIGKFDNALAAARHAIKLDENYSDGYAILAEIGVLGGDLDEALAAIQRAKRLHPFHPPSYHWVEGHILFQLARYDDAQPFLEIVTEHNPLFYRGLITMAANYGQQGHLVRAENMLSAATAINDNLTISSELLHNPYFNEERHQKIAKGLRKAGLAE